MSKVIKYLKGTFIQYLKTIFVTKEELALTQAEIQLEPYKVTQDIIDCKVAKIMADKTNTSYTYKGTTANNKNNNCIKLIRSD